MTIRTFAPGDDAAQVSIYNEAAADFPKFKPAALDEVRRRVRGPDFDPGTRFFAVEGGRPAAYMTFHPNGRVSYPWARKGAERWQGPLCDAVLGEMRTRGLPSAFAAYRGDWPAPRDFFLGRGFRQTREMINYILDLAEMPTPAARAGSAVAPLTAADVPGVFALCPSAFRARDAAELGRCLLHNPYFPPGAAFVLRSRTSGAPVALGLAVADPSYADPSQLDPAMPCFRLGAVGTEGTTTKRINGVFSFVAADGRDVSALALDLLGHAAVKLEDATVETFAAQVCSDQAHLVRFYKQFFRRQPGFPLYELALTE
jgi:hypothetical protein